MPVKYGTHLFCLFSLSFASAATASDLIRQLRAGDTAIVIHSDDLPAADQAPRSGGRYSVTGGGSLRTASTCTIRSFHRPPMRCQVSVISHDRIVIRREGAGLVRQRTGRPDKALAAETRDVFYIPGQDRVRSIFRRRYRSGDS